MLRGTQSTSEASSGSMLTLVGLVGLVCSPMVKADDNWNMEVCNKKQYMYFI